ncbi:hypothetical protein G6F65_020983 [Rhizopus arrhizus]|nr:hypothetical protein G6F65_020983 [Rhizopus arrhizus]
MVAAMGKCPSRGDSTAGNAANTAIWCASMRRPPSSSGNRPPALRTRCHCHAASARRLSVSSANAATTKIKVECRIGPPGCSAIRPEGAESIVRALEQGARRKFSEVLPSGHFPGVTAISFCNCLAPGREHGVLRKPAGGDVSP